MAYVKSLTVDKVKYTIKDQNAVTVNTVQEITKTKKFTAQEGILLTGIKTPAAGAESYCDISSRIDNGTNRVGGVRIRQSVDTNGVKYNETRLYVCQPGTDTNKGGLTVRSSSSDSTAWVYAENNPTTGSNSKAVATTAYINTKFKYVTALPSNPDADTFYFIKE